MPDVASLQVVVSADTTAAESSLTGLGQKVSGVGSAITGALGGAAVAAVAGLGAAFVGSVKTAADFEKGLSAISAVSGATATQLEGIRATALQLGKDTSFSATEAAAGMEEMVKAGVSLQDVMGGAGKAALDLAAAGGLSVAESATIASNAMNTFGKSGTDMAHIADVIAGAANASAIDVHDFGFSLSSVGAVAATIGVNFEDTAAAIAVLGQAGLKGSDAGTSLKTMLLNLSPSSKTATAAFRELGIITADGANKFFDAEGKAKSLAEISGILQDSLKGLTKEQQINALQTMFGTDAVRAAAIMAKAGAEGFNDMAAAMSKVTATAVAEERLNNLMGSLDKLGGSLETAGIMIGSLFTPALKTMADMLTDQVNAGIQVLEQIPDIIETIKQVMAGDWSPAENINPITNAVGELAIAFRDNLWPAIQVVVGFVTGTLVPALTAVGAFLAEHTELIAGLAAAWAAFAVISTVAGWIMGAIAAFGALSTAITAAGGVVTAIIAILGGPLTVAILAIAAVIGVVAAAWIGNWGGIRDKTAAAIAAIMPMIQNMLTAIETFWTQHGERIMTILTAVWTIIVSQVTTALTVLTGVITAALQLLSGDWEGAWTTMTTVAQAIWDGWVVQLQAILEILVALFGPAFTAIAAAFTSAGQTIAGIWQAGWDAVSAILTAAWNLLTTENQTRITALVALMTELWTTLGTVWTTGTTALTALLATWWTTTTESWTTAQTTIAETVAPWWTTIQGYWDAALKAIGDALSTAWAAIVTATGTFFTDLGTKFTGAVSTLGQAALDLGTAIMDKLIEGINAKVQSMLDAVTGAVTKGLNAARSLLGGASGSSGNASWDAIAREEGVDPALLASLIQQESGGSQGARSGAGAIGLTQLMPGTAASLGVDPNDPAQNVRGGARYLKQMLDMFGGDEQRALIAYNAGPGGGAPAESIAYARRVIAGKANVPSGVAAAQRAATPQLNQFGMTGGSLTAAEAAAFCGPAAAMWFAGIYGRMPDKAEAEAMARNVGWTPEWGMSGPGSEQRLLSLMGVGSNVNYSPTPDEIGKLAGANVPFMLSTAGHFYQVQGGSVGGLNVGGSGVAAGGSATMSLDQIIALSGAINGIITLAPQMGAALTTSTAQAGAGFTNLADQTVTWADGTTAAFTTVGETSTVTLTNAMGQVVSTFTGTAEQVVAAAGTMALGVGTEVTTMGANVITMTTDAAGNVITTTADMSGQVTAQYATLANGAVLSMADMSGAILTSTTDLGTGVMTTVQDMSGNYVTTITDLAGNVTSQYVSLGTGVTQETATMAAEVNAETAEMAAKVTADTAAMSSEALTSVTEMGDGVITITTNAAGETTATITNMAGQVTSTYSSMGSEVAQSSETMASDVGESVNTLVSDVQESFGDVATASEDATEAMESVGEVNIEAPDVGDVIEKMGDIEEAAKDAAKALDKVGDGDGHGDDDDEDHRAKGGPVTARHPYLVGEQGPELFVPSASGEILTHGATRRMLSGSGGGDYGGTGGGTETIILKIDIGGRVAEEIVVEGRALAIRRGRIPAGAL